MRREEGYLVNPTADPLQNQNQTGLRASGGWKKWLGIVVATAIVTQIYFVRELLAALLIFTVLFVVAAVIGVVIYLIGRAGETGIQIAEPAAKRGLELAEDFSKKTFHRPRSAPVQ
jgi:hypothetical protein